MASPLAQFEIKEIFHLELAGYNISFTNSSLFLAITFLTIVAFMTLGMKNRAVVPGRFQSVVELSYEFIAKMLGDTAGPDSRKYFPFIFSLFIFILFANFIGMIPYTFTVTSHIAVTIAMAMFVFLGVTIIAFARHGFKFLTFFVPKGAPLPLLLILVPIEVISYLSRPISLSVRLFANMVAGHTMLKVFGGFVVALGVFGVAPFLFIVALIGLELLVAFLQAYVFAVLTCMYLNDALHMSH